MALGLAASFPIAGEPVGQRSAQQLVVDAGVIVRQVEDAKRLAPCIRDSDRGGLLTNAERWIAAARASPHKDDRQVVERISALRSLTREMVAKPELLAVPGRPHRRAKIATRHLARSGNATGQACRRVRQRVAGRPLPRRFGRPRSHDQQLQHHRRPRCGVPRQGIPERGPARQIGWGVTRRRTVCGSRRQQCRTPREDCRSHRIHRWLSGLRR